LANVEYLCAAFEKVSTPLPVMLDTDGQRPAEIAELKGFVTLAQITLDGPSVDAQNERALESVKTAATSGLQHALVICVDERTTDSHMLRIVEGAHAASESTAIIVHPSAGAPVDRDRRWITLLERAAALHGDVRLAMRLPPPTGMR
jgi:hypothetical protein